MKKTVTTRYDVAEHLRTPEEMAAYLEACMEEAEGDAAFIAKALGDIARARGMSQVARDAGMSRESLYKALSGERTPGFDTILKVMTALGLKLHAEAVHRSGDAPATESSLAIQHRPTTRNEEPGPGLTRGEGSAVLR
jgi:probable addiction module antidote protein